MATPAAARAYLAQKTAAARARLRARKAAQAPVALGRRGLGANSARHAAGASTTGRSSARASIASKDKGGR